MLLAANFLMDLPIPLPSSVYLARQNTGEFSQFKNKTDVIFHVYRFIYFIKVPFVRSMFRLRTCQSSRLSAISHPAAVEDRWSSGPMDDTAYAETLSPLRDTSVHRLLQIKMITNHVKISLQSFIIITLRRLNYVARKIIFFISYLIQFYK